MCWKYKNQYDTVFIWCEIANGEKHMSSYLNCFTEMADAWEEVNGENLVWVPGHYEKKG